MQNLWITTTLLVGLFFSACDSPGIFEAADKQRENDSPDEPVLMVEVTGGFAGVNQNLMVSGNRRAIYTDSFVPGMRWDDELDQSTFNGIAVLMTDNNFFDLQEEYIDPQTADAFLYAITYTSDGETKVVRTDNIRVPENLGDIVSGMVSLVSKVKTLSPGVMLTLSKTEMQAGDSLAMILTVSNRSENALELRFNDGQIFDFQVFEEHGDLVWNWANDKAFTLALWQMTLQPGETKTYQISWDAIGNAGVAVTGTFVVRSSLVSEPGGVSEDVVLEIRD